MANICSNTKVTGIIYRYESPSGKYYEDDRFARAYGLRAYEGGVAIIYDKFWNKYYTVILGEDDGAWFPRESWTFTRKSDYIACMSEALSILNSNFNYD